MEYQININRDDSDINDFLTTWAIFKSRPNKMIIHEVFVGQAFLTVLDKYEVLNSFTEVYPIEDGYTNNEKLLVKISDTIFVSFVSIDTEKEDSTIRNLVLYYTNDSEVNDLLDKLLQTSIKYDVDGYELLKLNTLTLIQNTLDIEPIHITELDDTPKYYSKSTFKLVNKAIEEINNKNNGLSILYGERGLGKTNIIKYIASKIEMPSIIIPNTFIDMTLNNPEFLNFLKRFESITLFFDDCECLFNNMMPKINMDCNLLQMIDGIHTGININIVLIFNIDSLESIPEHILECNNMNQLIEFADLPEKNVKELCDIHKIKYKNQKNLKEIFNREFSYKRKIGL